MTNAETGNWVLDSFSSETRTALLKTASLVELPAKAVLFQQDEPSRGLYFLTKGLASVKAFVSQGDSCCVAIYGCAAVPGAVSLLGPIGSSSSCEMEVGGAAYRISLGRAEEFFERREDFRRGVLDFIQDHIRLGEQMAVCLACHSVESRLARWLITCSELAETTELPLTQESLAAMLATQRTTVTEISSRFQQSGLIQQKRGVVAILNRAALDKRACSCYPHWKEVYTRRWRNLQSR